MWPIQSYTLETSYNSTSTLIVAHFSFGRLMDHVVDMSNNEYV